MTESKLKFDLVDLNNLCSKDETLVLNQYTLLDASRISHSDCGSSAVKTYANSGAHLGSTQQSFD